MSADRDTYDTARREPGKTTPSHVTSEVHRKQPREEVKRFATAAEARAYLRGAKVRFEGETEEEEAAFDADDEISK